MTTDATNPMIKERHIKMRLKHQLTTEEKRELSESMADNQAKLEELEDEKKAVASDYKSRIETVQGEIRRESNTYRQGWDLRDIQCCEVQNFSKGTVTVNRLDTGEVIKSRPMTHDERTLELPFEEEAA
jgi:predicted nuclease with TOPRIM domain